jgi:hypothetical protein
MAVPLIAGGGRAGAPDQQNSERRGVLTSQPSVSPIAGGTRPHGFTDLGPSKAQIGDFNREC